MPFQLCLLFMLVKYYLDLEFNLPEDAARNKYLILWNLYIIYNVSWFDIENQSVREGIYVKYGIYWYCNYLFIYGYTIFCLFLYLFMQDINNLRTIINNLEKRRNSTFAILFIFFSVFLHDLSLIKFSTYLFSHNIYACDTCTR